MHSMNDEWWTIHLKFHWCWCVLLDLLTFNYSIQLHCQFSYRHLQIISFYFLFLFVLKGESNVHLSSSTCLFFMFYFISTFFTHLNVSQCVKKILKKKKTKKKMSCWEFWFKKLALNQITIKRMIKRCIGGCNMKTHQMFEITESSFRIHLMFNRWKIFVTLIKYFSLLEWKRVFSEDEKV